MTVVFRQDGELETACKEPDVEVHTSGQRALGPHRIEQADILPDFKHPGFIEQVEEEGTCAVRFLGRTEVVDRLLRLLDAHRVAYDELRQGEVATHSRVLLKQRSKNNFPILRRVWQAQLTGKTGVFRLL